MIIEAIGGLGLFLLGMVVMTEGLRALAGDMMRATLMRFTHTPLSGAITGVFTTAILQSSSATMVAAVGFVSADLISFPAALGIVFGANLGTTVTGWLVAIFGFKFKLGSIALPLIFIGASLKLLLKRRYANLGYAIAGFGLIFVGITTMQGGMSDFSNIISPERLPTDTFIGRLQLVALGVIATLITQSSSAGVALTLTLLYSGVISFVQAAALIIGMDVGTTVTAILATIGASIDARRTGLAHVVFNLFTATLALTLITPYTWLWSLIAPGQLLENAEIALVLFHTSFNLLGVSIMLPGSTQFARLIQKLIPSRGYSYTEKLDESLLIQPELALRAAQQSTQVELLTLLGYVRAVLGDSSAPLADLAELRKAINSTQDYVDRIQLKATPDHYLQQLINLVHSLDHMQRLYERCEEDGTQTIKSIPALVNERNFFLTCSQEIIENIQQNRWLDASNNAKTLSIHIHQQMQPDRKATINQIASKQMDLQSGTIQLEAIRWLKRVSKHIRRITYYLSETSLAAGK